MSKQPQEKPLEHCSSNPHYEARFGDNEQPQEYEWSVYEDGYGILEWHPKHKYGVAMLCRCVDRMEAQDTVERHNAALAALREQLAAEREKVAELRKGILGF
jgi:hypothetical protein